MGRGLGRSAFPINHLSLLRFLVFPARVASPDLSKRDQAIISFNLRLARYQTDSEGEKKNVLSLEPGAVSPVAAVRRRGSHRVPQKQQEE